MASSFAVLVDEERIRRDARHRGDVVMCARLAMPLVLPIKKASARPIDRESANSQT